MKVRDLGEATMCEVDGCDIKAADLVYSRALDVVMICCKSHADKVVDESNPEYWDQCHNCHCRTGVN